MQQFTVPQFIDVEDKIIGPITARQFIIMLSGFMVIALCYKIFDFSAFIVSGLSIFAVSGIFAFFKINGMPFHFFVLNFIQTSKKPSLRVWNNNYDQDYEAKESDDKISEDFFSPPAKPYSGSRLAELSLIVDTRGAYRGEEGKDDSENFPTEKLSSADFK